MRTPRSQQDTLRMQTIERGACSLQFLMPGNLGRPTELLPDHAKHAGTRGMCSLQQTSLAGAWGRAWRCWSGEPPRSPRWPVCAHCTCR